MKMVVGVCYFILGYKWFDVFRYGVENLNEVDGEFGCIFMRGGNRIFMIKCCEVCC